MAEHITRNDGVVGSIPTTSSKNLWKFCNFRRFLQLFKEAIFDEIPHDKVTQMGYNCRRRKPNLQRSGEVHTLCGLRLSWAAKGTTTSLRRVDSMRAYSIWRCAGSAGVYLSAESGKDIHERHSRFL